MLGQYTGNMGMVVLDTDFLRDVCVESVFCCRVFRVQIVGNRLWIDIKEALEVLGPLTERGQCLQIFKVTDMVADKGLSSLAQAKGILEMPATGQERHREIERELNRLWCRAA